MELASAEGEKRPETQRVIAEPPLETAAPVQPERVPLTRRLFSTSFWLFLTFSSIALFPVAVTVWLVTLPFDRQRRVLHQFTCFWASLYTWLNPAWPVTVRGREHIRPGVAYVMVANHQSLLDILVLFRLFSHFKWVSKAENFKVPCIGWNMTLNGYVKLRRGDRTSIAIMMTECQKVLERGSPIMMFPEGTRSRDGRLKPFKHGAFTLAKRLGVPVLPIVLTGTGNALPKAGFLLRGRHPIELRVLPPIDPDQFAPTVAELAEQVRGVIARELDEANDQRFIPS